MGSDIKQLKRLQLEHIALHRQELQKSPRLHWLFFEITNRCNLRCKHCGSNCMSTGKFLTTQDIERTLRSIIGEKPMICLTGGEPLLHPDFFEIAMCVKNMGFSWGMTTNATLIDKSTANKLKQAGLSTVSVSLDGLESSHDTLRQQKGSWQRAINGILALKDAGFSPQVTTVLHQDNFDELDALYSLLCKIGINSWRPINVEPIGRACESKKLLLTSDQFSQLISFIIKKRFDPSCKMEVTFGCSHYLGIEHERMARDHYFLCGAGILTASVRSNGDICACLDIENRPELVQGNIRNENFMDVWCNGFLQFRRDRTADCSKCKSCSERLICGGDSAHTWDFAKNEPLLCYQNYCSELLSSNAGF